jgi:hypothetical protein
MTYVAGWWEPYYDLHAFSKSGKEGGSTKSGKKESTKSGKKKSTKSGKKKANDKSGKKNSTDGGGGSDVSHDHGHGWHGDGYGRRLLRE